MPRVRGPDGAWRKVADPESPVEEAILEEALVAAGALATPPEPEQLAAAVQAASRDYQQPADVPEPKVADVSALVAQALAQAGVSIPGGPRALEAFLLGQAVPSTTIVDGEIDAGLRQLAGGRADYVAEKTEFARQAMEQVSETLARGGGKRAATARKLREEGKTFVTVIKPAVFCHNGLWVEMPVGRYAVPHTIAERYMSAQALAADVEREDLVMRWQEIVNPDDPLRRMRKIEPTQFRVW